MTGPVPRGWRRCKWRGPDDPDTCGDRLPDNITNSSVVALCAAHAAAACPRGTADQMREQYAHLVATYGWKAV